MKSLTLINVNLIKKENYSMYVQVCVKKIDNLSEILKGNYTLFIGNRLRSDFKGKLSIGVVYEISNSQKTSS